MRSELPSLIRSNRLLQDCTVLLSGSYNSSRGEHSSMAKQVPLFAASADDRDLRRFLQAEGLHLVPLRADLQLEAIENPQNHPLCYISLIPQGELRPDKGSPPCVSYVQN